ncbi:DUF4340 domain-containing protein [Chondromyces apiculatus]|uniref:DUF4340 domain-containing protein n=1 Tax=Chondromyces apiculatus DSM 436 TaxID=1192034 RepID=A0A017T3K2_9BACT|nr:DUF4340 domain-containing protein [Chondromyces apiculatus]EYF03537.1 Hypothetical protein CAP_5521 [Chondromyces apiculatus DSM 436]
MKTEHRIYIALALLALLGVGLFFSQKNQKEESAQHSVSAATADLPKIGVPKDDIEKITKLEIKNADKSDVTLEKKGDTWEVVKPVAAKANATNIRSLLDNLKELKTKEPIDRTGATYEQYELTDAKAVHVVAYKGAEKAADLYFGKSGSRGQMVRLGGQDGVWIAGGYSSYLYTREAKNWRETSILKFEDANAIQVEIENKNGKFSFSKNEEKWSGTFAPRDKKGKLEAAGKKWEKFEESKVKDLLRAYKNLNAEDFGDEKSETGLDNPVENGGVVRVVLKDNAGDYTIKVGKTSKGSSRFAVKEGGDGTTYVLSSWSADWAVAEPKKFEKSDEKKGEPPPPEEGHGDIHPEEMMMGE